MEKENEKIDIVESDAQNQKVEDIPAVEQASQKDLPKKGGREFKKNPRRSSARAERPRSEFDQKVIDIRRVTRVAAGGRRFQFSVAMVLGNRKGSVGVGLGKGGDTALAIDKAMRNAKKNMIHLNLTSNSSIPHTTEAKYSSARIIIMPSPGRGMSAGSSVRNVLELAGIKDISAKIRSGSKNKLNIARCAIEALSEFKK